MTDKVIDLLIILLSGVVNARPSPFTYHRGTPSVISLTGGNRHGVTGLMPVLDDS
ncbi:hypothetical protein [Streptomyces cyaneofuscatus]|uniref:hypothetical protein n=1 Tax=Streptomyces cyaneofuscatus TaxID=66883 RepID=UPI00343284DE